MATSGKGRWSFNSVWGKKGTNSSRQKILVGRSLDGYTADTSNKSIWEDWFFGVPMITVGAATITAGITAAAASISGTGTATIIQGAISTPITARPAVLTGAGNVTVVAAVINAPITVNPATIVVGGATISANSIPVSPVAAAPILSGAGNTNVSVNNINAAITTRPAALVAGGLNLSANAVSAGFALPAPSVSGAGNANISVGAVSITGTARTAVCVGSGNVNISTNSIACSPIVRTATLVEGTAFLLANALSFGFATQPPTIVTNPAILANVIVVSPTLPAPTFGGTGSATLTVSAINAGFAPASCTLAQGSVALSAAAVSVTGQVIPAILTGTGTATLLAGAVSASFSVQPAFLAIAQSVTANVLNYAFSVKPALIFRSGGSKSVTVFTGTSNTEKTKATVGQKELTATLIQSFKPRAKIIK